MSKKKITVAVTGLNNIDSPGPGIPVIRALRQSQQFDVRIIGLSYESLEPGLYLHELVDKSYQIPLPTAGTSSLMDRLSYIHQKEKFDVLIPNFDAELYNFIKLEKTLKETLQVACFLPSLDQFEARHKSVLYEFGKKNNVSIPKSFVIHSTEELNKLEAELGYPMVVKGKYYDAHIAHNPEQAHAYFHKISSKWGLPIILQEYVYGSEVNVTALGDGLGNCVGAVAMRKLYITDKGKAWSGISIDDEELLSISRETISNSKWRGGCELEFIKSGEGKYYLLEMNPRFPAWVFLAVGCGQNHPEALVRMALGQKVAPFTDYEIGKLFIRYSFDQIVDLKEFEEISIHGEL